MSIIDGYELDALRGRLAFYKNRTEELEKFIIYIKKELDNCESAEWYWCIMDLPGECEEILKECG